MATAGPFLIAHIVICEKTGQQIYVEKREKLPAGKKYTVKMMFDPRWPDHPVIDCMGKRLYPDGMVISMN